MAEVADHRLEITCNDLVGLDKVGGWGGWEHGFGRSGDDGGDGIVGGRGIGFFLGFFGEFEILGSEESGELIFMVVEWFALIFFFFFGIGQ